MGRQIALFVDAVSSPVRQTSPAASRLVPANPARLGAGKVIATRYSEGQLLFDGCVAAAQTEIDAAGRRRRRSALGSAIGPRVREPRQIIVA